MVIMKKFLSLFIVAVLIFGLSGCFGSLNEKLIVGTWIAKKNVLGLVSETEYVFNEDGTGSMSTVLGIKVATTYTIDEDTLSIVTDAASLRKTYVYKYDFVDDSLVLTDSEGIETILYKL